MRRQYGQSCGSLMPPVRGGGITSPATYHKDSINQNDTSTGVHAFILITCTTICLINFLPLPYFPV